jgi:mannose-1-phosphate guanylyltransferase
MIQEKKRIFGYKENAYWLDIGTPTALFKASRDRIKGDFLANVTAQIDSSATLTGGTSIGAHVTIAPGATLDHCIVSDGARIATGALLERCFLAPGTIIDPQAHYRDRYISIDQNLPIAFL